MGQHKHRRLRADNEIPDDHAHRDDHPSVRIVSQHLPEIASRRHKPCVHPGEEKDQPCISVRHSHCSPDQRSSLHPSEDDLEEDKEYNNRQKRHCHLLYVFREFMREQFPELHRIRDLRDLIRHILRAFRPVDQTEHEHGQDGPH